MKKEILNVLESIHEAKTAIEINDLLGLQTALEYRELCEELEALVSSYEVFKTKKEKYILLRNCPSLRIGKLSLNKKGYGFVLLEKEEDLYIPADMLDKATHDDVVLAEITRVGVKREGKIIRVLKRDLHDMVGELYLFKNKFRLKLDDDKKDFIVVLDPKSTQNCVEGHKVLVHLVRQLDHKKYYGEVKKILGHKDDPGVDILSIAYKYQIESDFGVEVEEELKDIPNDVDEASFIGRRDYTNEMVFTIDGSHTKDIDDAISLTRDHQNYILGVHIADVSHYVKENTALGDAAYLRGTSSYLADTVIPMIPHQLSNGICSLNENELRLSMSCVMTINPSGEVIDYEITPSYIKSMKKMTYEAVNDILMRDIVLDGYEPFVDVLRSMNELAHILQRRSRSRGYMDFALDEARIVQDEFGKAIDVVVDEREDAEKLIESFMIVANETVATHIYNMELPFLYRVHGEPNSEKIDDFVNLVKLLGYELKSKVNDLTPKTMQSLLEELDDKPEFKILSSLLLRSMRKAIYSKDNIGHFGLASEAYTHFTSPIRRYPDLVVHRLLKKYLVEKDFSMSTIAYLDQNLVEVAAHSSEREQAADEAERDVDDMKMAEYMESHVGEEYDGVITTVTNFGFFVELPNLIEGLVHVNSLKGDYYNYVPESLALIGNNTKKTYRIGDHVRVRCISASKETAMIDFELVGDQHDRNKE
ncbi:MAG: ribonuclease R [Bacilli bacterium]|nr:ribonuclease R [Bacilli bacterium]